MFKRTRYQFGCLQRKPRAKGSDAWVLRFRQTQADGSKKLNSIIVGTVEKYATEAEAWKAAEALRLSLNPDNVQQRIVTLGALLDRYIAEDLPERNSTARFYLAWLNRYVRPKWGEYPLSMIKPFAVEQWLKSLDLAPKSKAHIRSLMHILFNSAMRWSLLEVQANPMSLVRVKDCSKRIREPRVLTAAEFQRLLQHLADPCRTMAIVGMCLGLRISEVIGLQWGDFDWGNLQVFVQRSVVFGVVGEVKTRYSRKRMPLDPALAERLFEYQRTTAPGSKADDWVFPNPDTGQPWTPGWMRQQKLVPAAVSLGFGRIGWHTFRHSYSTMLRSLEVDIKVQQELLRHADIRTTMNLYTQAVPDDMREANSMVARLVLLGKPK
jgi:integrase